jgi:hypothetical protein
LSQRIEAERAYTQQHVRELWELLPPNLDRFNLLFMTALQGSVLEVTDRLGAASAQLRLNLNGEAARLVDFADTTAGTDRFGGYAYGGAGAMAAPAAPPMASKPATGERKLGRSGRFLAESRSRAAARGAVQEEAEGADFYFKQDAGLRGRMRQFYQQLDNTQEWAENNYYQRPLQQQTAGLITVNAFWNDYARHDAAEPFWSTHFAEASRNLSEILLALAILDLPFEAGDHESRIEETALTLTAASPMVVFHEEIRGAKSGEESVPILVSQNFYRHGDRYQLVNGEKRDKFVKDEFLVATVYGCQVVVTNPTSSPQKLDVLLQIPQGAIPVLNSHRTRSLHLDLQPYHTNTIDYHFYFPAEGRFPHYPVHVAKNELLLAYAEPVTLNVVAEPSRIDRSSWDYVSQHGSEEDVIGFLRNQNLQQTDLTRIAFRMANREFFARTIELLARRHVYNHTLWSYAIKHNEAPAIREYLLHANDFVAQCGASLESPLLSIDPLARKAYEHLEYRPLVNARAHMLGAKRQILNDRLFAQYHNLLRILSCRPQLDDDDRMSLTYYLLLQDRIEEAMRVFGDVRPEQLKTAMQYDYFVAYLALFRADLDTAREIASRYGDYPVDRWRRSFAEISQQLDEIAGAEVAVVDPDSREQTQTKLAATEPSFELQVEAKRVRVLYQNLERIRVNYYLMDIELLFSRNPFVQEYSGQFSHIRPNLTAEIQLPAGEREFEFAIPDALHHQNVMVEMVGAGQVKTQAYYSNSLAVQLIENYGRLYVTHRESGRPLPKTYVKVYARLRDGRVRFYKDGYTDLRGCFDYASLSTNDLDFVQEFALLVLSDEDGAIVREANSPKR